LTLGAVLVPDGSGNPATAIQSREDLKGKTGRGSALVDFKLVNKIFEYFKARTTPRLNQLNNNLFLPHRLAIITGTGW